MNQEPDSLTPPPGGPLAGPPPTPPGAPSPEEGPASHGVPGWVPVSVVAGTVLLLLGLIVGQIPVTGDAQEMATLLARLAEVLGALALASGYMAFLLTRASMARAVEALALSASAVLTYGIAWHVLLKLVSGEAPLVFFVAPFEMEGRGAMAVAAVGLILAVVAFGFCFRESVRIVWPYFRAGVALNVLAMVHIVVLLLGVVSALNARFSARVFGGGVDLTSAGQFSLSEKTRGVLSSIEGDLVVAVIDLGGARGSSLAITARCRDLLKEYEARCPSMKVHQVDPFRKEEEARRILEEGGMRGVVEDAAGTDDLLALSFRPRGDKSPPRTLTVPINQEFVRTTSLGKTQFEGEGILTNAIHDIVFTRRRVVFTEGHGERSTKAEERARPGVSRLVEALRGNNFDVERMDLSRTATIPADADLVVVASPQAPFKPAEAEALRAYLGNGGAVILMFDPPDSYERGVPVSGLEDLMSSYGVQVRRDVEIVSWYAEQTLQGPHFTPIRSVIMGPEEVGRHPSMEAIRRTTLRMEMPVSHPVFRTEKPPEGVDAQEILFAPRDVSGRKPFGALRTAVRPAERDPRPVPGDIVDRRLSVAVASERRIPGAGTTGGRLVVLGDSDFLADAALDAVPLNRTLALNLITWAVRRDLIVIDPKSLESDIVNLSDLHKELSFWITVVALPLITLGIAVGVWWSRRR